MVPDSRRYVPGTNVLETTWHTPTGWLTVHDMLVMGPPDITQRRADYKLVPGDAAAKGTLLRIAKCFGGRVEMLVDCMPMFDYGANVGAWSYDGDGYDRVQVEGRRARARAPELASRSASSARAPTAGPRSSTASPEFVALVLDGRRTHDRRRAR